MTHYYKPGGTPIKRHIMLAPANFGSQLAHKGRAWYGRVFKGWRTGLQTGGHLLHGLELASPYSWALAERDVLAPRRWYGTDLVQTAVLVGNSGYGGAAAVTNEVGGDGTVRVSTANLNASRLDLDFTKNAALPVFSFRRPSPKAAIAFGISDGDNHSSIAFKEKNRSKEFAPHGPNAANWLIRALTIRAQEWPTLVTELADSNAQLMRAKAGESYFHGYQNTVVRLRDDVGNPVEEFLVEFSRGRSRAFALGNFSAWFQREIVASVHNYSSDSSVRSFYLDITTLAERLAESTRTLQLEIEAQPRYRSRQAVGYPQLARVPLDDSMIGEFFKENRTLLVDVKVPRTVGAEAFKLKRHSG